MSTAKQRQTRTEERGLLAQDLATTQEQGEKAKPATVWERLFTDNGGNPFTGREFVRQVASGRAGFPALSGAWPKSGPKEWRQAAGVTTLQVAYAMQIPEELVLAWEAGEPPNADNWRGGEELDDSSALRLYGAFKSYSEAGPHPEPAPAVPAPPRPAVKVLMGEGFPRKELLEAAALPYEAPVPATGLAGEGAFLRVVVRGEVVGIPVLEDTPSGAELKRIREQSHYSPERFGALLGAAASRVLAWEDGIALPGADCDGGLAAALRLYGTLQRILELRQEAADAA